MPDFFRLRRQGRDSAAIITVPAASRARRCCCCTATRRLVLWRKVCAALAEDFTVVRADRSARLSARARSRRSVSIPRTSSSGRGARPGRDDGGARLDRFAVPPQDRTARGDASACLRDHCDKVAGAPARHRADALPLRDIDQKAATGIRHWFFLLVRRRADDPAETELFLKKNSVSAAIIGSGRARAGAGRTMPSYLSLPSGQSFQNGRASARCRAWRRAIDPVAVIAQHRCGDAGRRGLTRDGKAVSGPAPHHLDLVERQCALAQLPKSSPAGGIELSP